MKKLLIMIALLTGLSGIAHSQSIEIKGFELGMSKQEAEQNWKDISIKSKWANALLWGHRYMTLAGYDVPKPTIWYDAQGNVGELAWFICYDSDIGGCNMQGDAGHSPSTFNAIADAIQSKYDMTCEYETLQNGFGAQFQNEFCEYEHNGITLRTQTYHKGIDQGRISIFVKNDSIDRTQDL